MGRRVGNAHQGQLVGSVCEGLSQMSCAERDNPAVVKDTDEPGALQAEAAVSESVLASVAVASEGQSTRGWVDGDCHWGCLLRGGLRLYAHELKRILRSTRAFIWST